MSDPAAGGDADGGGDPDGDAPPAAAPEQGGDEPEAVAGVDDGGDPDPQGGGADGDGDEPGEGGGDPDPEGQKGGEGGDDPGPQEGEPGEQAGEAVGDPGPQVDKAELPDEDDPFKSGKKEDPPADDAAQPKPETPANPITFEEEEVKIVRRGKGLASKTGSIKEDLRRRRTTTIESLVHDDAEDKMNAENLKWQMPSDFYYEDDAPELAPVLGDHEFPTEAAKPMQFIGFDFHRHYNLVWTSHNEFAYITGHVICIINLSSGSQRYLNSRDNGGIGAIAMSPDMTYLAVAEKNISSPPSVYIYAYKTTRLYRILRKGTQRAYASVQFSPHNKSQIAALGCAPDFLLSVWDWKHERLLLKCKAYGQDVFTIRWGQFPGMLTSAGTGHIRFWKMATTFTGLKLQGDIGKFGATELSDVTGFVELPDGKIVTGSEYGKLLLWEGVFVKVELMRADKEDPKKVAGPSHTGQIDVVMLDEAEKCVVSGGDDGYLRWWPVAEIDEAEADYDNGILEYSITMRKEARVPPASTSQGPAPAHIQHVAVNRTYGWLIQDLRNGVIWGFQKATGECSLVVHSHARQVTGTLIIPQYPGLAITSGIDGTLRAFNLSDEFGSELFLDRREGGGITCLSACPEMVDPERRTLCCGYADGTVRVFCVCRDGFVMAQAIKPHTSPVMHLAYSPDGSFLATLGGDNTIFFFEIRTLDDHAVPLGFVKIPQKVSKFAWHHETGRLLLGLEDGSIVELMRPSAESIDNAETYHIELDYRAVLPELPEPEESEDEEEEEEGAEGQEADAAAADASDPSSAKKRKKEKVERDGPSGDGEGEGGAGTVPTVVSQVVYFNSGKTNASVLFVGTGEYSGGLWEMSLDPAEKIGVDEVPLGTHTPTKSMCTLHTRLPKDVEVTHMSMSPSGRFVFLGFVDGRAWAIPLVNMSCYSNIAVADSSHGAIHSIYADPEEHTLLIGGGDGSVTSVLFNSAEAIHMAEMRAHNDKIDIEQAVDIIEDTMPEMPDGNPEEWELPDVESPGFIALARDITDPNHYSIQDAKLKSEEDNAKHQAEQKKKRVRERIDEIREELEELQTKNANNSYGSLASSELIIDQEYISYLVKDMENKVEDVRFELAWSVEFHERGVEKLRDYYLSRLDFERIEVLGFRSPHRVATFRCPSMSRELKASLARLHELIFAADRESNDDEDGNGMLGFVDDSHFGGTEGGRRHSTIKGSIRNDAEGLDHGTAEGGGILERATGTMPSGAEQREMRRQQRQQRKQQMLDLERAKPSDSYEDPQDVDAISHAEATLGNYMLKTSDSYQVPENQRMNAEKKRRQMFLLEESMHAIKTEFNHRVLALRGFRQQVCSEVKRDLAALQEIDQQLSTDTPWVVGLLDTDPNAPPEFPECRFEYTEGDLKSFARQLKGGKGGDHPSDDEEWVHGESSAEEPDDDEDEGDEEGDSDGDGGVGSIPAGGMMHDGAGGRRAKRHAAKAAGTQQSSVPVSGRAAIAARRIARLTLRARLLQEKGDASKPLGKSVAEEAQARLWHDKIQLEEHIRQVVDTFNNAVASIEKEKAKLESDLKNADMKLLVLYEELLTLNELEEKDEALLRKATKCRQDKTSIMHSIKECQDQLGEKKTEIEQWHREEQTLQAEFTELVGENSPFLSALLKIYKKKVKRSKRKKGLGDDEDFDEDEDEDEEESDFESDDEDDEMEDDVGPPQGCDVQIYDSVIDLRDRRLEMEDGLQEIQKAVEELKKQHKKLLDDEKRIDKEQKQTDAEIQQFQTDKQRKLNQVQIVFALRMSQVQCLNTENRDGCERLPAELDQQVVFTHEGLSRLMSRITELHQEIREVKSSHKQLQRDFRLRKKEKNQANQHIEDLQTKFQDIQMLKFGQIVDLDLIERSAPNRYVQELQEKVLEAEAENRRKLADWEKRIEKQKKELVKVTSDNTRLMEQIVSMGYSQMQLDAALNARIANVTVNDTEPLVELREMERDRLKDLLQLQSKEIATLQAEINLFRKKGGHIYTTVTANRVPEGAR